MVTSSLLPCGSPSGILSRPGVQRALRHVWKQKSQQVHRWVDRESEFDDGVGEREDVRAALDFLQRRFPQTALCVIGFSFGAWVGLDIGAQDSRVVALIGLGLPTNSHDLDFLLNVRKPKLIVQGTEDSFGPKLQVESLFQALPEPKWIHWVEGADHFFTGRLDEMESAVTAFLQEVRGEMVPG